MKLRTLRRKTGLGADFIDVLQIGALRKTFARNSEQLPEDAEVIFRGDTHVEYEFTEWEDVPLVYENATRESV